MEEMTLQSWDVRVACLYFCLFLTSYLSFFIMSLILYLLYRNGRNFKAILMPHAFYDSR